MKNAKKTSLRKLLAGFAVGGVLLSGLVVVSGPGGSGSLITDASAGVSGGGGGGGGGGAGGTAYATWQQISRTKANNGTIQNMPPEINSDVCRNAEAYFALVPNVVGANAQRDSWTFNLYGVRGLQGGDFAGGADLATRIANNVGWSYQQGRDYLYQKNFICLDNPNVLAERQWRYEVRSSTSKDSLNENQVYNLVTQIAPQPIEGKADPAGAANLHSQSDEVKTNYGKVWDDFKKASTASGASSKDLVEQFKSRFADAKNKDKSIARGSVDLDAANRAGMGEGGVLNISEFSRMAKATASTSTTKYQVWRCGWDRYTKSGWQPSAACERVGGSSFNPNSLSRGSFNSAVWKNSTERNRYNPVKSGQTEWERFSSSASNNLATQQKIGFWQLLAVHCNPAEFAALVKSMGTGGTVLSSGDSSNTISGLIRTRYFTSQPATLPFGDSKNTDTARKATSKLGFFDKECPFDCTPSKTGAGASSENGAVENVGAGGATNSSKGVYGSKVSSKSADTPAKDQEYSNSNYAEIFRDNQERTVRPDVWYPVSGKGVNYDGSAPKSTLFTRWAGGTPTLATYQAALKDGKFVQTGGEFEATAMVLQGDDPKDKTKKSEPLFSSTVLDDLTKLEYKKPSSANQKNFDAIGDSTFRNANASQFRGLVSEFNVKSSWASDSGKPQAMQVAWEYSPSVNSTIPSSLSFATGGGNIKLGSNTTVSTNVDGRCWGTFGTTATTSAVTDLASNTGTGKTTNFTVPNGSEKTPRNMVFNFVRGASE